MSLKELGYVNIPREVANLNKSRPDPPYNFRPRTIELRNTRNTEAEAQTLTISVPGIKDLVFTGALAKKSMATTITRYLTGPSDRMVDYESESGSPEDEDEDLRRQQSRNVEPGEPLSKPIIAFVAYRHVRRIVLYSRCQPVFCRTYCR